MSNSNLNTVLAYYQAINEKKADEAAKQLHDEVQLITPLDEKHGKSEVLGALNGFCSAIESLSIRAQFAAENQVMLAYDIYFPEPVGQLRAAGLLTLEQKQIIRIELFYDGQAVLSQKDAIFSK